MKILVVDDEPIQRRVLCRELQRTMGSREGFALFEAGNGRECLAVVAEAAPDLLFLDLRMPVMGGMEVARELAGRETPRIIILSAFDDFTYAQEAMELGVSSYLLKPFNSEEVRKSVEAVEEGLRQQAEKQAERRRLLSQLERVRPIIAGEYVNEIITGVPLAADQLRNREEILGITHPITWCMLVDVVSSGLLEEHDRQWQISSVHQALQSLLAEEAYVTSRIGFGRIACFGVEPLEPDATAMVRFAQAIQQDISGQTGATVSIGVSTAGQPADLHNAYSQAYRALEHAHLVGGGVVHAEHLPQSTGTDWRGETSFDRLLADAVRLGDSAGVRDNLRVLCSQLHNSTRFQAKGVCLRTLEILILLCRNAVLAGVGEEAVWEVGQTATARLLKCQGSQETAAELQAVSEEILCLISKVRNVRTERLIAKVVAYVRESFAEPLTLEAAARQVYLSPFYFSHVFRQEMGQTFIDYLTQVRVEAAEDLLKDTVMSVGAISERVGYNDVNYFSRVFKKATGVTPTQFRKRNFRGA